MTRRRKLRALAGVAQISNHRLRDQIYDASRLEAIADPLRLLVERLTRPGPLTAFALPAASIRS
ncbi:hypothetical protein CQW49_16260 [Methylosinus trichosporium OB3b]|uniref:Uncharacterized protein n=1 Tax=Methylosinus trichosporium (strain ATCC 35070 / NCIMB 11131 / UNIQEM 75 / OB3b) TaxID=595536 RepID=A0A2D2D2P9_METT3|nr:hypothetical protein CQW49_16260 [Methylosinus trichosporium OB3b]OBS53257.1 hypothetical protein A8B73_06630 [Methylosinus sp. 3S-1]